MQDLEYLAVLKPGFSLGRDSTIGAVPEINQLTAFYAQQFFWRLTGLSDLRRPAPQSIQLHLSDEQILALIKRMMAVSGQKPAPH